MRLLKEIDGMTISDGNMTSIKDERSSLEKRENRVGQ